MTSSARKRRLSGLLAVWLIAPLFLILANSASAQCTSGFISSGSGFSGFNNVFYVLPSGGSGTLNLTFNGTGCTWSIASTESWATVSPASGTNTSASLSISVNAAVNVTSFELTALISLTVNGLPAGGTIVYQNSNSCTLTASTPIIPVSSTGGSGSFTLATSPPGCWYSVPTGTPAWVT